MVTTQHRGDDHETPDRTLCSRIVTFRRDEKEREKKNVWGYAGIIGRGPDVIFITDSRRIEGRGKSERQKRKIVMANWGTNCTSLFAVR